MFPHFCSFTYALSKMLGRQFSLPPEIALRPVDALSGYQLAWLYYGLTGGGLLSHGTAELRGTCPDSQLIRAKKTAIVEQRPRVRCRTKLFENTKI
jgi:hypothetical protein